MAYDKKKVLFNFDQYSFFGYRLAKIAEKKKIRSIAEIAERTGLANSTLCDTMNGKRKPTPELLITLIEMLKIRNQDDRIALYELAVKANGWEAAHYVVFKQKSARRKPADF